MAKEQKPNYESYVRQFRERQRALNKPGDKIRLPSSAMLNRGDFEFNYYATKREFKRDIASGERAKIGNITRTIISRQAYDVSFGQSKSLASAIKATKGEKGGILERAISRAIEDAKQSKDFTYNEEIGENIRARFEKITARDLRLETPEARYLTAELKAEYNALRQKGLSGKEANRKMAQLHFNSPT